MSFEPPTDPPGPDKAESVAAADPLDERLSAALDGAAASEPHPTVEEDELAFERLRALEAARDVLSIPPPPLDDLTRRRLLRTAVAASTASKQRDLRRLSRVTSVAAVVALVVLAGWGLTALNHSAVNQSSSKTALTSKPSANAGAAAPLDLHEVSDPLVLRQRVQAALGTPHPVAAPDLAATTSAPRPAKSTSPTLQATPGAPSTAGTRSPNPDAPSATQTRCLSKVRLPGGGAPSLLGIATYHGRPALVVVARDGARTSVVVLAADDCQLLSSQFLQE